MRSSDSLTITETVEVQIPQIGLYPISTVLPNRNGSLIKTDNGNLTVIPIYIPTRSFITIAVTMASTAQDFSLRVWVSRDRNGAVLGQTWNPSRTFYNTRTRKPDKVCVLYTPDLLPPPNVLSIPVEIGSNYYINILNLAASDNAFLFDLSMSQ